MPVREGLFFSYPCCATTSGSSLTQAVAMSCSAGPALHLPILEASPKLNWPIADSDYLIAEVDDRSFQDREEEAPRNYNSQESVGVLPRALSQVHSWSTKRPPRRTSLLRPLRQVTRAHAQSRPT